MATDSSVSELAGRYRRLAALVEQLEADGYDVVDAEPTEDQHGRQHAEVQLNLDGGLGIEPFHVGETEGVDDQVETGDEMACSECGESHDDGACWDDDDDQDEEFAVGDEIDDDGFEVVDTLQEAMEQSDEPNPDSAAGTVLDALREEGELPASALETITGVSTIHYALRTLDEDGWIETRPDPDDGRRTLYRPAEMDVDADESDEPADESSTDAKVWCGVCGDGPFERLGTHASLTHDGFQVALDHEPSEAELVESDQEDDDTDAVEDAPDYQGPDPEATVAESSLSAHIVLDDVLDACVDAARADAPVVACVTDELGVHSDAVVPVLQALGLKQDDRRMLVDDVGAQVAAIRQEVSDE